MAEQLYKTLLSALQDGQIEPGTRFIIKPGSGPNPVNRKRLVTVQNVVVDGINTTEGDFISSSTEISVVH